MTENKSIFVGKFKDVGINKVNIDEVVKQWTPKRWYISRWENTYRIIKCLRRDSEIVSINNHISENQALEIIKRLGLVERKNSIFKVASRWRLERTK